MHGADSKDDHDPDRDARADAAFLSRHLLVPQKQTAASRLTALSLLHRFLWCSAGAILLLPRKQLLALDTVGAPNEQKAWRKRFLLPWLVWKLRKRKNERMPAVVILTSWLPAKLPRFRAPDVNK
jgi:hypothetical protein